MSRADKAENSTYSVK